MKNHNIFILISLLMFASITYMNATKEKEAINLEKKNVKELANSTSNIQQKPSGSSKYDDYSANKRSRSPNIHERKTYEGGDDDKKIPTSRSETHYASRSQRDSPSNKRRSLERSTRQSSSSRKIRHDSRHSKESAIDRNRSRRSASSGFRKRSPEGKNNIKSPSPRRRRGISPERRNRNVSSASRRRFHDYDQSRPYPRYHHSRGHERSDHLASGSSHYSHRKDRGIHYRDRGKEALIPVANEPVKVYDTEEAQKYFIETPQELWRNDFMSRKQKLIACYISLLNIKDEVENDYTLDLNLYNVISPQRVDKFAKINGLQTPEGTLPKVNVYQCYGRSPLRNTFMANSNDYFNYYYISKVGHFMILFKMVLDVNPLQDHLIPWKKVDLGSLAYDKWFFIPEMCNYKSWIMQNREDNKIIVRDERIVEFNFLREIHFLNDDMKYNDPIITLPVYQRVNLCHEFTTEIRTLNPDYEIDNFKFQPYRDSHNEQSRRNLIFHHFPQYNVGFNVKSMITCYHKIKPTNNFAYKPIAFSCGGRPGSVIMYVGTFLFIENRRILHFQPVRYIENIPYLQKICVPKSDFMNSVEFSREIGVILRMPTMHLGFEWNAEPLFKSPNTYVDRLVSDLKNYPLNMFRITSMNSHLFWNELHAQNSSMLNKITEISNDGKGALVDTQAVLPQNQINPEQKDITTVVATLTSIPNYRPQERKVSPDQNEQASCSNIKADQTIMIPTSSPSYCKEIDVDNALIPSSTNLDVDSNLEHGINYDQQGEKAFVNEDPSEMSSDQNKYEIGTVEECEKEKRELEEDVNEHIDNDQLLFLPPDETMLTHNTDIQQDEIPSDNSPINDEDFKEEETPAEFSVSPTHDRDLEEGEIPERDLEEGEISSDSNLNSEWRTYSDKSLDEEEQNISADKQFHRANIEDDSFIDIGSSYEQMKNEYDLIYQIPAFLSPLNDKHLQMTEDQLAQTLDSSSEQFQNTQECDEKHKSSNKSKLEIQEEISGGRNKNLVAENINEIVPPKNNENKALCDAGNQDDEKPSETVKNLQQNSSNVATAEEDDSFSWLTQNAFFPS